MIQMSREQYQQKYGAVPSIAPTQSTQPIRMTRAQYQQKYGVLPGQKPKSLSGFAENVFKSGGRAVNDLATAAVGAFNPNMEKNTIANLGKTSLGLMQKLDPTKNNQIIRGLAQKIPVIGKPLANRLTNQESRANALGDFYKNRYGGVENIKKTLYEDPVGVVLDASTLISGAGALTKGAGIVGKSSGLTKTGTNIIRAGEAIDPFVGMSKLAGKVTRPAVGRISKTTGLNEDIALRGLGNPAKQAKLQGKYGYSSPTQYIEKYKQYGRDPEALQGVLRDLKTQYDDLALRSGNKVDVSKILNSINDEMLKIQNSSGKYSKANQAKLSELLNRRNQILDAFGMGEADVADITMFRRQAIDPDIPQSTFGLDTEPLGRSGGTKTTRDILKKTINDTDLKLKELGQDISYGLDLKPIFEGYQNRAKNRQMLNFSRLGGAGLGGFFGGIPGALTGFAAEQIVNNPYLLAYLSKAQKPTRGLFSKAAKSTKALKKPYSASKGLRLFSRDSE